MSRRSIAIIAVAVALTGAVALLLNNDAWIRALIESQVTARAGRALTIGDLQVDWSLTPRIRAENVRLGNAEWGSHPTMLDVSRLDFTVRLSDLLHGDLVLPEVALSHPWVLLEFGPNGERNWILKRDEQPDDEPPRIERLSIDSGELRYRNRAAQTDVLLKVATNESAPDEARTKFAASGVFRGLKASAAGTGGAVVSLRDETLAYPLKVKVEIGATRASANGEVAALVTLSRLRLDIKLEGPGLRELGKIIELPLPESLRYWVAGNLSREGQAWHFVAFRGALGKSDLAGDLLFEYSGERRSIRAELVSKQLVLEELPLQRKAAGTRRFERLRAFDAHIKLTAKTIKSGERALGDLSLHAKLANGELTLSPLSFAAGGGKVEASALLDVRGKEPQLSAEATASSVQLEKISTRASGSAAGSAKVASSGVSLENMIANSNGDVSFVVSDGEISGLLVSYVGLNAMGLFTSLIGDRSRVAVNCAVADFTLKSGVMHTDVLVVDTARTDIVGSGTIDLAKRAWDLTFSPLREEGFFSRLLSGGAPVHVGGTFANPELSADVSGVAARASAAAALAIMNPLAALIPLLPSPQGKEANCAKLVAESESFQQSRR